VDDVGAQKIAKALAKGGIIKLDLQWNQIWADGAEALAFALIANTSLRILDLGHNDVRSQGAEHIANLLRVNKFLREINLCDNNIDDVGVAHLLSAMDDNHTLHTLTLECNPIVDSSLKMKIQEKLQRNRISKSVSGNTQPPSDQRVPTDLVSPRTAWPVSKIGSDASPRHAVRHERTTHAENEWKKKCGQLTPENNTLKAKMKEEEQNSKILKEQLENSVRERMALERQVINLVKQLNREKSKADELAEAAKKNEKFLAENQKLRAQVVSLKADHRTLTTLNETLSHQVATWSGSNVVCEKLDFAALAAVEDQLDASLRTVRNMRTQRLQRRLEEIQDSKRCKVCFESSVDVVLLPCKHHILCNGCSEKVQKCPVCNTQIQNRIRTFEC